MTRAAAVLALAAASVLAASCGIGQRIRAQVGVVRDDIEKARHSGAYRCAPRALALAEAHAWFALGELDQGDFVRAEDHVNLAIANVRDAIVRSAGCAPQEVIVRAPPPPPPPPPVIIAQRPDRDGDTVVDDEDRCPDVAGLPELQGCPEVKDTDGDGLPDESDKCPNDPEDFDGVQDTDGCPDLVYDRDSDGLADDADGCPDNAEDFDGFQDEDGCPEADNDRDGVVDGSDMCPLDPGPAANGGCPVLDRDGDGIADASDRCPDEPGVPEQQGCPAPTYKLIVVNMASKQIELKQKVHFETGRAVIKPESFGLLNEVAQAMTDNTKMQVIIEGHTDSVGSDSFNLRLSQQRADSVKTYLARRGGVAEDRMESIGFGETRPVASNQTARGRETNRRVEFKITKYE